MLCAQETQPQVVGQSSEGIGWWETLAEISEASPGPSACARCPGRILLSSVGALKKCLPKVSFQLCPAQGREVPEVSEAWSQSTNSAGAGGGLESATNQHMFFLFCFYCWPQTIESW